MYITCMHVLIINDIINSARHWSSSTIRILLTQSFPEIFLSSDCKPLRVSLLSFVRSRVSFAYRCLLLYFLRVVETWAKTWVLFIEWHCSSSDFCPDDKHRRRFTGSSIQNRLDWSKSDTPLILRYFCLKLSLKYYRLDWRGMFVQYIIS